MSSRFDTSGTGIGNSNSNSYNYREHLHHLQTRLANARNTTSTRARGNASTSASAIAIASSPRTPREVYEGARLRAQRSGNRDSEPMSVTPVVHRWPITPMSTTRNLVSAASSTPLPASASVHNFSNVGSNMGLSYSGINGRGSGSGSSRGRQEIDTLKSHRFGRLFDAPAASSPSSRRIDKESGLRVRITELVRVFTDVHSTAVATGVVNRSDVYESLTNANSSLAHAEQTLTKGVHTDSELDVLTLAVHTAADAIDRCVGCVYSTQSRPERKIDTLPRRDRYAAESVPTDVVNDAIRKQVLRLVEDRLTQLHGLEDRFFNMAAVIDELSASDRDTAEALSLRFRHIQQIFDDAKHLFAGCKSDIECERTTDFNTTYIDQKLTSLVIDLKEQVESLEANAHEMMQYSRQRQSREATTALHLDVPDAQSSFVREEDHARFAQIEAENEDLREKLRDELKNATSQLALVEANAISNISDYSQSKTERDHLEHLVGEAKEAIALASDAIVDIKGANISSNFNDAEILARRAEDAIVDACEKVSAAAQEAANQEILQAEHDKEMKVQMEMIDAIEATIDESEDLIRHATIENLFNTPNASETAIRRQHVPQPNEYSRNLQDAVRAMRASIDSARHSVSMCGQALKITDSGSGFSVGIGANLYTQSYNTRTNNGTLSTHHAELRSCLAQLSRETEKALERRNLLMDMRNEREAFVEAREIYNDVLARLHKLQADVATTFDTVNDILSHSGSNTADRVDENFHFRAQMQTVVNTARAAILSAYDEFPPGHSVEHPNASLHSPYSHTQDRDTGIRVGYNKQRLVAAVKLSRSKIAEAEKAFRTGRNEYEAHGRRMGRESKFQQRKRREMLQRHSDSPNRISPEEKARRRRLSPRSPRFENSPRHKSDRRSPSPKRGESENAKLLRFVRADKGSGLLKSATLRTLAMDSSSEEEYEEYQSHRRSPSQLLRSLKTESRKRRKRKKLKEKQQAPIYKSPLDPNSVLTSELRVSIYSDSDDDYSSPRHLFGGHADSKSSRQRHRSHHSASKQKKMKKYRSPRSQQWTLNGKKRRSPKSSSIRRGSYFGFSDKMNASSTRQMKRRVNKVKSERVTN